MAVMNDNTTLRHKYFWESSFGLLIIVALIGISAGLGVSAYQTLVRKTAPFFLQTVRDYMLNQGVPMPLVSIIIPSVGGLLVGLFLFTAGRNFRNQGVPEVIEAVIERNGILSPHLIWGKMLGSALTICTGGSAGIAGPTVEISGSIGSNLGRWLKAAPKYWNNFLACGAAAGIAAAFNAPMGGVIFAQELILGELVSANLILIVVSAVAGSIVSRSLLGDYPAFQVFPYQFAPTKETFFYIILGLLAGICAVIFIKMRYKITDWFQEMQHVPSILKPLLAAVIVGILACISPLIYGLGYEHVEGMLSQALPFKIALLLLFLKMLATSVTLGSGAPGGDFSPGLFIGAMLGGSFGYLVNFYFPDLSAPAGAYALIGMGGMIAGMYQAPITAVIMLFEMTGDYGVVLPLMLVCVLSALVAKNMHGETMYTEKLARKGLKIKGLTRNDVAACIRAARIMTTSVVSIDADLTVSEAWASVQRSGHKLFPVAEKGALIGAVKSETLRAAAQTNPEADLQEILLQVPVTSVSTQVFEIINQMAVYRSGHVIVADAQTKSHILGIISRSDIIAAYAGEQKKNA